MKNLKMGQEILNGRRISEIPLPPFDKGGQGDFWQARGSKENSIACLRLCQSADSSGKLFSHVILEQSRNFVEELDGKKKERVQFRKEGLP
jgi:hypothetical protein